jgi:oxalate decarboxylase/phosphoglucose isomerase-like protein (cupin superfamily)
LLDDRALPFGPGDAVYVPSGVWHAVSNTGDEDAVMVFGFPHPDYPPTERRG